MWVRANAAHGVFILTKQVSESASQSGLGVAVELCASKLASNGHTHGHTFLRPNMSLQQMSWSEHETKTIKIKNLVSQWPG